ncbi:sulfatase-like hydrolase/transferase [Clostridium sp. MCC353]|uniref:sulfatase-like hydrolase/transferase n=1 Tax=Clostridium sp. MCC353 TaxID=2592646 RepID=UPI001C00915A|nr:sulfatase-like hydrolase/transferase [Clostridium sp. MCC353]MBT9775149.1 sulfatase-like hydrolase/transferase [Clostridium sp. MCC353]
MKNPNVLFLMCDQLSAYALYNPACLTPNIDKLRRRSVTFDKAHTVNAVCSPSRASLMTGLLPHNHGVLWVTHNMDEDQGCLREEHPHFAQILRDQGYTTGYFGKWHVEHTNQPKRFGWQYTNEDFSKRDFCTSKDSPEGDYIIKKTLDRPEGYDEKRLFYGVRNCGDEGMRMFQPVSCGIRFIESRRDKEAPWVCMVSTREPHDPFICTKEYYDMYDVSEIKLHPSCFDSLENQPYLYKKAGRAWAGLSVWEKKEAAACYYASITQIDKLFGSLIDKLDETGQSENTIIVLTADHGELLGAKGLYSKNISASELIYNIPLILSAPGCGRNAVSHAKLTLADVCQTVLDLCGAPLIETRDSRSGKLVLENPQEYDREFDCCYAVYFGGRIMLTQRIVWDGSYKYVFNGFDKDELYDLEEDPYELKNLIDNPSYREILKYMVGILWTKLRETGDKSLLESDYPILRLAPYGPEI